MRLRLSEDRRTALRRALQAHFLDQHGEEIGELKANLLIEFFVEELGSPVYHQAIEDARKFIQERLDDLEGDLLLPGGPAFDAPGGLRPPDGEDAPKR